MIIVNLAGIAFPAAIALKKELRKIYYRKEFKKRMVVI